MRPAKFKLAGFGLVLLTAALASCAVNQEIDPFSVNGYIWPEPPDLGRIAHVAEFARARDLGIHENAFERLLTLTAGSEDTGMIRPMDVVVSGSGDVIYVADPEAACVHVYDLRRSRYKCMTASRTSISPIALAITDDGELFVSDSTAGRLYHAEPGSKRLELFNTSVSLNQPTGIIWDSGSELLYVTDTTAHMIKVFDRSGNFEYSLGGRGIVPGSVNYPTYLWMDAGGELLVTDSLNFRLQRVSRQGESILTFGKNGDRPGDFARPKGVATDSYGHVYVVDALMHALQIFNREGELLLAIGRRGHGVGEFWLPNGIFVSRNNLIFVADSYNKRVQVFRYIGNGT